MMLMSIRHRWWSSIQNWKNWRPTMEEGFMSLFPNPNQTFRSTVVQNEMSSFHRRLSLAQELEGIRLSVCKCGENQYWDRYFLESCLQVKGIMVLIFSWHLFASVRKRSEDDNLANAHLCNRERVKNYSLKRICFFSSPAKETQRCRDVDSISNHHNEYLTSDSEFRRKI